ncbi:hypothetical protein ACJ73_03096 [Blastomyces percursus]|uniref:Uncharacterized protein n=1 Tax=Blastomyces percursus TaxID=1658174 RepID=A0A1J9RAK2_9EURO|nr:hypothetical protein ACJ73_03096 [Blastomyces percursus]
MASSSAPPTKDGIKYPPSSPQKLSNKLPRLYKIYQTYSADAYTFQFLQNTRDLKVVCQETTTETVRFNTPPQLEKALQTSPVIESPQNLDYIPQAPRDDDNERYRLCVEMRDVILQRYYKLASGFDAYERVMETECAQYRWQKQRCQQSTVAESERKEIEQWNQFIGVATSGSRQMSRCVHPLTQVSKCWGQEKIEHYKWHYHGEKYCKRLSAAAN